MALVPLFADPPGLVTLAQVLALDPPARVGWLANLVEKVVGLYSGHFRRVCLADELLDLAWRFAESRMDSAEECSKMLERCSHLAEAGGHGAYSTPFELAPYLLAERLHPYGHHAIDCVERAAIVLVKRLHWATRTTPELGQVDSYSRRVKAALFQYAQSTIQIAGQITPRRGVFDSVLLVLPRLQEALVSYPEDLIPEHERGEFILPPGVVWQGE